MPKDILEQRKKMLRIIEVLKSRLKEMDALEQEIKERKRLKNTAPKDAPAVIEEIIVPPLQVLK